jgi:hypothetical protein
MQGSCEVGVFKNLTASANVKPNEGFLLGFYVNSTSAGTIQLYDDPSTGTTTPMSGVITPAIGFHRFPAAFATGLNVVIGSTLNVTMFYA